MKSWYVVNTKPHSEFKVINYLNSKKYHYFYAETISVKKSCEAGKESFKTTFPKLFFCLYKYRT